jgi:hypothetical protein
LIDLHFSLFDDTLYINSICDIDKNGSAVFCCRFNAAAKEGVYLQACSPFGSRQ